MPASGWRRPSLRCPWARRNGVRHAYLRCRRGVVGRGRPTGGRRCPTGGAGRRHKRLIYRLFDPASRLQLYLFRRKPDCLIIRAEEEYVMKALAPWTGFTTLQKEIDRLFERFWEPRWDEFPALAGEWTPSLDLSETKDALVVKAEIPGIDPKEIEVSLQDQVLTIKGEKRQ